MISWNKIQRRNPINDNLRWYPTIALSSVTTADDVILGIVEKCTLAKVDVKAVHIALEEVIIEQLKNGNSVRFGSLGSFRPTLQTRFWNAEKKTRGSGGCMAPTDEIDPDTGKVVVKGVDATNIKGISVCFSKSSEMIKKLSREQLVFRNVPGEKTYKPML